MRQDLKWGGHGAGEDVGAPQPGPVLQVWPLSVGATRSTSLASLPLPHCVPPGRSGHWVSWVGL